MKLDCNWWMDLTVFALGRRSLGHSDGAAAGRPPRKEWAFGEDSWLWTDPVSMEYLISCQLIVW